MKSKLTHLLFLALTTMVAYGQKKDPRNRVFVFDYETKTWDYEDKSLAPVKRPYFRIPYKSQPVVKVTNLPAEMVVEIESNLIDIRPESGQSKETDQNSQVKALEKLKTQKQDSIKVMELKKRLYQSDTVMKLSGDEKIRSLISMDSFIDNLESEIVAIENQIEELHADNSTVYVQTSRMVDSDEVEYIVTFSDSSDTKNNHNTSLYARVFGGLKIDLSTGALFHTVVDKSFHYAPVGTDQSQIVKDRNKSKFRPIFPVVFTNIYWRQAGGISPGISLGLGIDDSGQSGYYLGPSLILGDRQRAIFSAGCALRPADDLKGKYKNGQVFDTADAPDVEDLVESSFKLGLYLSLSYNLTTKVERRK